MPMQDSRQSVHPEPAPMERALRRLSARARSVILGRRAALLVAGVVAALLIMASVDFALRLPVWIRWINLLAGAAALGFALWRWLWPALRFRPQPATLALRLEQRDDRLKGWLASAVDLADPAYLRAAQPLERALAERVVRDASQRWSGALARGAIDVAPAVRGAATLALSVAVALAVALSAPALSRIGALRTLAPWLDAAWPRRTAIVDATAVSAHPRGVALPVRAALLRSPASPQRTDVAIRYRLIDDGKPGPSRRALLTWQRRDVSVDEATGALFERLIETDADAVEYSLETSDDATPVRTVRLIDPPAVRDAHVRVSPPGYAAEILASGQSAGFDLDMGDGRDERAVAPTALAGSTVELTLTLNKPVPAKPGDPAWMAQTFGESAAQAGLRLDIRDEQANVWTLSWRLFEPTRLRVALEDEYGIASLEESVFRFSVVQDAPARVAILEPAADRAVLPTALVQVKAEGRDDVGLDALWVERQIAKPDAGPGREPSGAGGALKPAGESVELARQALTGVDVAEASAPLDIAALGVAPGDEIWLTAFAQDILGASAGERPPTQSAVRRLRIISQSEFIADIQRELSAIRQDAIRIDERQSQLIERLERIPPRVDEARRGQAQVSQRIARQGDAIERVRDRLAENALDDPNLSRLLDQAQDLLGRAAQRSQNAQNALDELAQRVEGEDQQDAQPVDEQVEGAKAQQQSVRDALARLAELLDRGEDAWVARRKIEDLARQQSQLREQAQALARETAGKTQEELTPQQRSELERIAEAQRRLAEGAREATRQLRERERKLRDSDPAAAAGLARAAQRASERQTDQTMEQAAEEAQRNQLGQAARSQQQAASDLQQMLEDLDHGQREREETLRRLLTSLIDGIDSLVRQQRNELARLDAVIEAKGAADGLDAGMIALNANTLGALDEASAAGPEIAPVADLLGQAVEAQTRAIIALRPPRADADAPPLDAARQRESESLDLLEKAKAEAERLERELAQQMAQRQRNELRRMYRDMLVEQRDVREQSGPLAEQEPLSRRARRDAQALSQRERALSAGLEEMRKTIEGLEEAQVFLFTNDRLEQSFGEAEADLAKGEAGASLPDQDAAIRLLQSVLRALADARKQEDELREAPGGGGGGGQQSQRQVIPPLTELRLLRELQQDLALRTREAAQAPDADQQAPALGQEQSRLRDLGQAVIERIEQERQQQNPFGGGPPPGGGP